MRRRDMVKFIVVPDAATAAAGLKSGAIDAGRITSSDAQLKYQKLREAGYKGEKITIQTNQARACPAIPWRCWRRP